MKTLRSFFFFVTGVCLLMTCTESDYFPGYDPSGLHLKKASGDNGVVIVVDPPGDFDTENILQAFNDAATAGPGSVVQLQAGNYHVGFLEIRDFTGKFIGAGKGNTIITAKTGLDPASKYLEGSNAILIKFIGGDVSIEDMTLNTPPGILCTDGTILYALLLISDYGPQYTSAANHIKAVINNVEFTGMRIGSRFNSSWALAAMNDNSLKKGYSGKVRSDIDLTVTNCSFNVFNIPIYVYGIREGKINIGAKNNGNVTQNTNQSLCCIDIINADIAIVSNTFNFLYYGLNVENGQAKFSRFGQGSPYKRATCNIEQNTFNNNNLALVLHEHRIVDYPDDLPMLMWVRNNTFNSLQEWTWGIEMIETPDAVVSENKFTGSGDIGIYNDALNGMGIYSENCLFRGNNFSTATFAYASPYVETSKAIWLGSLTKNFTIIGNSNGDIIHDNGVNNVITGMNVNTYADPLGQSIVDNIRNMVEEMPKDLLFNQ